MLKYAHENGCARDYSTCSVAAEKGDLDVLKYAHENGCPWNAEHIRRRVAAYGNREMITYVEREIAKTTGSRENGCPECEDTSSSESEYYSDSSSS